MTEIAELLAEVDRRRDLEAKAQRADELELRLVATRAGLPDLPVVDVFLGQYSGNRTEEALRVAWARHVGDDSGLTPRERLLRSLDQ